MNHLGEISIFVEVVRAGSFTKAAGRLGLTRSTVSKAIARLEDRLGVRLLNRTTRRLSVTEAGSELYEAGARALAGIEDAEGAVSSLQAEPRGTLRISAPVFFGVQYLAPVVSEFMKQHPRIGVDVQLDDHMVDLVAGRFDMAVRSSKLRDSSLISRRIAASHQVVCASPGYWDEHGVPERPEDLAEHNCLIYNYLPAPEVWEFLDSRKDLVSVTVRGNFRYNNTEFARDAARRGLGILYVPTFYVGDDIVHGRLAPVLQDYEPVPESGIYAIYPARRHLPLKVRLFIDLLVERLGACE